MAAKKPLLKTVALLVILGVPALLCLGLADNRLSPRAWAIGLLAWFVALLSWMIVVKLAAKKTPASSPESAIVLDDYIRRRILRRIWIQKTWIGILAILLPIGIVDGITHRAWLPTSGGVGISLLWMCLAAQDIRQSRKRLTSTRE